MVLDKGFARFLLIAETVLPPAVRALPGYGVARHSPGVFRHANLAYAEAAPASPAECKRLTAAVATRFPGRAAFFPVC